MSDLNDSITGSKPLGFLGLPEEIRRLIYEDALASQDPTGVIDFTVRKSLKDHASLLCTNKLINHEATPIFYAINTFRFYLSISALRPTMYPAAITNRNELNQARHFRRIDIDITHYLACMQIDPCLEREKWDSIESDAKKFGLNHLQQLRLTVDRPLHTIDLCNGKKSLCDDRDLSRLGGLATDEERSQFLLRKAYDFLGADIGYDRVAYLTEELHSGAIDSYKLRHIAKLVKVGEAIEPEYTEVFQVNRSESTGLEIVNVEQSRLGYSKFSVDLSESDNTRLKLLKSDLWGPEI